LTDNSLLKKYFESESKNTIIKFSHRRPK